MLFGLCNQLDSKRDIGKSPLKDFKIWTLLNPYQLSVKHRDLFESLREEANVMEELSNIDCTKGWVSLFTMIHTKSECHLVLNAVSSRVDSLGH